MHTTVMSADTASIGVSAPKRILQSVLAALNEGKISKAVDQFDVDAQGNGTVADDNRRLRRKAPGGFRRNREAMTHERRCRPSFQPPMLANDLMAEETA